MFRTGKCCSSKIFCQLLAIIATGFIFSVPVFAGQNADITITANGISTAGKPSVTFMQLRISAPDGQVIFDAKSDGAPVTWSLPGTISDGLYSYEVVLGKEPKINREQNTNRRGLGPKTKAMIESGNFRVQNSVIVLTTEDETTSMLDNALLMGRLALNAITDFLVSPAAAAQVFVTDVVVQGSECVGVDCPTAPSFGFDTIRLQENSLRIHFDDTSNSASFPDNDWRIVINDSSNGGGNYFAVEDSKAGRQVFRVDAGAPANSLRVDSQGDVGIGTSGPVVELHVADGDSPTLRLEQNGSSGFTPQTWDVAGNETNFFVRDVTNGSKLPLKIIPGAPDNSLVMHNNGNIGIGKTGPAGTLDIYESNAAEDILLQLATTSQVVFKVQTDGKFGLGTDAPSASLHLVGTYDSTATPPDDNPNIINIVAKDSSDSSEQEIFRIASTGDAFLLGNLDVGSSRSFKENIYALNSAEAVSALEHLEPVHFNYRASPNVRSMGFIAEDVPDLIATNDRKSLRPMDIIAVLTKVTQQQQNAITELNKTIAELQERIETGNTGPAPVALQ